MWGGGTFGIMLMENVIRQETESHFYSLLSVIPFEMTSCFIWVMEILLIGATITWILKLIPGIRKMI